MLKNALFTAGIVLLLSFVFMQLNLESERVRSVDSDAVSQKRDELGLTNTDQGPRSRALNICLGSQSNTADYCQCYVDAVDLELGPDAEMAWEFNFSMRGGEAAMTETADAWAINLESAQGQKILNQIRVMLSRANQVGVQYCQHLNN